MFKRLIEPSHEKAYRDFMLRYEVLSLRLACIIGGSYTLLFLVLDYWRAQNYEFVLIYRSSIILILASVVLITTKAKFARITFDWLCIATCTVIPVLSFMMDYRAGMPEFFLPNFLCLLLYVFNSGLGHSLKLKTAQSSIVIILYLAYAQWFSPHHDFQLAQIWNLIVNMAISIVIGFLIERYKRLNYNQREELIVARKKIEQMNATKSKLISIISHDLKSPLNNLKGLLHLHDHNIIKRDELEQHLGKVSRSVDGMSFLLENLLRWSKTQFQKFEPTIEKLSAKEIVREVIYSLQSSASEKGITLQTTIDNEHFLADREMVKLVIRNLLTNSIKFSYSESFIHVEATQYPTICTLSIKDSGTGMSADDLENIFNMKNQSTPGTQKENGTGIGLMLTKDFIETMKGSISVESEQGKGSTFFVTLPSHSA
jgi:signal transduction histidine kinase